MLKRFVGHLHAVPTERVPIERASRYFEGNIHWILASSRVRRCSIVAQTTLPKSPLRVRGTAWIIYGTPYLGCGGGLPNFPIVHHRSSFQARCRRSRGVKISWNKLLPVVYRIGFAAAEGFIGQAPAIFADCEAPQDVDGWEPPGNQHDSQIMKLDFLKFCLKQRLVFTLPELCRNIGQPGPGQPQPMSKWTICQVVSVWGPSYKLLQARPKFRPKAKGKTAATSAGGRLTVRYYEAFNPITAGTGLSSAQPAPPRPDFLDVFPIGGGSTLTTFTEVGSLADLMTWRKQLFTWQLEPSPVEGCLRLTTPCPLNVSVDFMSSTCPTIFVLERLRDCNWKHGRARVPHLPSDPPGIRFQVKSRRLPF